MHSFVSAKFAPSWRLALALSLLLHGSVLLPCLFLTSAAGGGGMAGSPEIDTCVPAPAREIRLLPSPPRRTSFAGSSGLYRPPQLAPVSAPAEKEPEPIVVEALASRERHQPEEGVPLPGLTLPVRQDIDRAPVKGGPAGSGDPSAGAATTLFFEIATQARSIVYVIDRSASMGLNGCLAGAKRELLASLQRLPASVRFQIIVYNRTAEALRINGHSGLVYATSENKRCVASLLEDIPAEGGTEHLQALRQALALGPEVIYFLTDAADLRAEQIRAITALNRGRCVIHAVELGRTLAGAGNSPLCVLARENLGCYQCLAAPRRAARR